VNELGMAGVLGIDHLGIAVRSIPDALRLFGDVLGARFVMGGDDPVLGIRTVQLVLPPGTKLELMQPIRDDSYLHGYLDTRGEGFHHLTLFVRDLPTALAALEEKDFEVVDTDLSDPKWRVTYVRPRSGFGTLVQIAETSVVWDQPVDGITLDAVLAGEVVWHDERPTLRSALPPEVTARV
jgi:methylmalonyl-CoA/ethylmalonyl-CoA epimerase